MGVVVQLVRIPACHAGGRGFESRPLRQLPDGPNRPVRPFSPLPCGAARAPGSTDARDLPHIAEQEDRPSGSSRSSSSSRSGFFGIDYYFRSPVGGDTIATVGRQRIGAGGVRRGAAPAGRALPPAVPRPVRRLAHGQPRDPPRGARPPRERAAGRRSRSEQRRHARSPTRRSPSASRPSPPSRSTASSRKERYEPIAQLAGPHARGPRRAPAPGLSRDQQFRDAIAETAFVPAGHARRVHPPLGAVARGERGHAGARRPTSPR